MPSVEPLGDRKTNRSTSALVRNLGLGGADGFGDLAEGPVQPVIQVGDLSQFATEHFPVRAVAATLVTSNDATIFTAAAFKLTSLGESGVVIEDLRLEAIQVSGTPIFPNAPEGAWIVLNMRDQFNGVVPRYPFSTETPVVPMTFGSVSARSRLAQGTRQNPGTFGAFLPPQFQIQAGIEWFIPPGYDFVLQLNSQGSVPNPVLGSIELGFREVAGIGSGGFIRGE